MLTIKNYVLAESLKQAYEYNQKRQNVILGGMGWLKLSDRQIDTAIDLSGLGLDEIEEDETEIRLGCMVTLRQIELHKGLNELTDGAAAKAVRHIVGVQFRNCATIGGSVYGRYGFSDILTWLLTCDAYVELYQQGMVSLQDYAKMPYDRDLIVRIHIKKVKRAAAYDAFRNQATDLPVLTCGLVLAEKDNPSFVPYAVVGARPLRAVVVTDEKQYLKQGNIDGFADDVTREISFGSNLRASEQYRKELAKVLLHRNYEEILERSNENRSMD